MFLQPKKLKFKKVRKGTISKLNFKVNKLNFGLIGLKSIESGTISAKQIESARQAIMRRIKRSGKLWIRIYPNNPITNKPVEVRMGKGKGSVIYYSAKAASGTILFELCGVNKNTAVSALKTGGAKLPVKTKIVF